MESPATGSNDEQRQIEGVDTVEPACEVVHIQSLMANRQLRQIGEWVEAQLPWRRRFIRQVRDRIRAA